MSREKSRLASNQAKLIVITGPTGSGKTGLSIKLALWLKNRGLAPDGFVEIVGADSRQVYKEMNIGTAKPTAKELKVVPHHLIDIIRPDQEFSAAEYKKLAEKTIKEIIDRGNIPFLVGGSLFYLFSITKGWAFPRVAPNRELRKKLEQKSEEELFLQLKNLDPCRAKTIEKQNKRRLIRAIEIAKSKGKVQKLKARPKFDCLILGLKPGRETQKQRLERRADEMIKHGLEQEVKHLVQKYSWQSPGLCNTIGYKEWLGYFEGRISQEQVIEKIKTNTWQFAKRQMMWLKREKDIHWIKREQEARNLISNFLR